MAEYEWDLAVFDSGVRADACYQIFKDGRFIHKAFWTKSEAVDFILKEMGESDEYSGRRGNDVSRKG